MYPLCSWKSVGIKERLKKLIDNEFYYEAVVVSSQLIEQIFKRIISSKLIVLRKKIIIRNQNFYLENATSKTEIQTSIKNHCQSLKSIERIWKKFEHDKQLPDLIAFFDQYCGQSTWSNIISNNFKMNDQIHIDILNHFSDYKIDPTLTIKNGLANTRHLIVHDINALPLKEVKFMSYFGFIVIQKISNEEIYSKHNIRSPFIRNPSWR
jgi:hypothetical protein